MKIGYRVDSAVRQLMQNTIDKVESLTYFKAILAMLMKWKAEQSDGWTRLTMVSATWKQARSPKFSITRRSQLRCPNLPA